MKIIQLSLMLLLMSLLLITAGTSLAVLFIENNLSMLAFYQHVVIAFSCSIASYASFFVMYFIATKDLTVPQGESGNFKDVTKNNYFNSRVTLNSGNKTYQ